jgi:EAL and modified HD-GYP domain-containing signal transduction protein
MTALIQREPILNRHKTITASRLRVHASSCMEAAAELNRLIEVWPDTRSVFVSLVDCPLDADLLDWQPPQNTMVEIAASSLSQAATQTLMHELVSRQILLCLDDYTPGMPLPPAANFRFLLADAELQPDMNNAPGSLLAKSIADHDAFNAAITHGYAGATGWFYLKPQKTPSKELNPAHARIIQLLNLVRSNAEIKDIEIALKQDVTLAFKLLRYINSAGFGVAAEVGSFKHAVTIMGYEKLNRWLSLLLVNASQDQSAPALMQTAVIRGRIMELLGGHTMPKNQLDNLFITGAFSILDTLLGTELGVIFQHLQLPVPITDALLHRQGTIAPFLELALTCETGSSADLHAKLAALGLSAEQCNSAQIEALAFADKLQFS